MPTNLVPARSPATRGVTLFEVLIVVAILALIAGSVGIGTVIYLDKARRSTTETNALEIRRAVKLWWSDHDPNECPSVDELVSTGTLDRGGARRDAWGEPFRLDCADHDVVVTSTGSDKKLGTPDDIRVPPA